MGLHKRTEPDPWTGRPRTVITADGECPNCGEPSTIAHVGFEVAAITMAEPLRRAFREHLDAHGCAERLGFAYCPEAVRLFELLPAGDTITIG